MRSIKIAVWTGLALAAALAARTALNQGPERAVAASPPAAIPVTAGVAAAQDVPIYAEGLGSVESLNTVNVKTRVDGQITRVFFHEGDEVGVGDRLFQIDPRPYQVALAQSEANLQKDTAQLQGAQRDLERYGKLVGSGFQSRQSYENQQATVAQLQAATQADAAAIAAARLQLDYALIRAPVAGRTGALQQNLGSTVQAGAGATLVTITQLKPIYVAFTLPADRLDSIRQARARHPLQVEALAGDGRTVLAAGTLSFIDNHVDASTGTIALKASFANTDERLWPGEFVTARLTLGVRPDAVTVPAPTVMAGPAGAYVYVVRNDDTVQRRPVQVTVRQDGMAVIGKGLKAGEKVVVSGQYRLADNARVRIEPAAVQTAGG
jgi:multidrug efflux system membrane fusion protein